jgi:hypothetical protein
MHVLEHLPREEPARDFGLIRKDNTLKTGRMEAFHLVASVVKNDEVFEPKRCARHAIEHDFAHEDPIAVEKYRASHQPMPTYSMPRISG